MSPRQQDGGGWGFTPLEHSHNGDHYWMDSWIRGNTPQGKELIQDKEPFSPKTNTIRKSKERNEKILFRGCVNRRIISKITGCEREVDDFGNVLNRCDLVNKWVRKLSYLINGGPLRNATNQNTDYCDGKNFWLLLPHQYFERQLAYSLSYESN